MFLMRQLFRISSTSWVRALTVLSLSWTILVYIFVTKLDNDYSNNNRMRAADIDVTATRINQLLHLLKIPEHRNDEFKKMIVNLINENLEPETARSFIQKLAINLQNPLLDVQTASKIMPMEHVCGIPNLEYEFLRRRIKDNVIEMSNYFTYELDKIRKRISTSSPNLQIDISNILMVGVEYKRLLLSDMYRMQQSDGHENWRLQESKDLSNIVQRRLHHLQNPTDCAKARKLLCKLNKNCGYGCQLHHAVYCFIVAYATERTLILKSKGWHYHKGGWEKVFHPVSDNCFVAKGAYINNWPGEWDTQVLVLPVIDSLMPRPPYLPLAIPEDLAPRLKRLHRNPIVWWVGQFLKYLLRPQVGTKKFLEMSIKNLGWKKPIVGLHIRRTDKVDTEADFHPIEEYMAYVEDYFLTLEINGTVVPRRIYVASDDPRVIRESRKKYPQYEVIGDADKARIGKRYTDKALNAIITDIHLLSLSDYLVCTFSSQVCRVAYEIMQTLHADASDRFKSLDDIYYYGGQNAHNLQAVVAHTPHNHDELHMRIGDLIYVSGNHWNGFSKGNNTRTNQTGLFPSFKVIDKIETVKLPLYIGV